MPSTEAPMITTLSTSSANDLYMTYHDEHIEEYRLMRE